ncbi:hypothetical protein [Fulvivirga kasyanovii]|uniref:Uncharacterized protein n=1 Tax=Fulvivirga kasyanovii TaxID=396812 RepID=A0ABW9RI69_9BACT|nr:hypothetical protein [Fulvivirga kasyanovii]MTI23759.1 hypothetical protein [Fulvivirga kasyanovii]
MKDTLELPDKIKTVSSIKADSEKSLRKLRYYLELNKELQPMIINQGLLDEEWREKYIQFSKYADKVLANSEYVIKAYADLELYLLKYPDLASKQSEN